MKLKEAYLLRQTMSANIHIESLEMKPNEDGSWRVGAKIKHSEVIISMHSFEQYSNYLINQLKQKKEK